MLFNSYSFVLFIAIVVGLHYMQLPWKLKKINLLLASYLFYAVWNPPFVLLLWASTALDFFVGRKLYVTRKRHQRKVLLALSLALNLGMLAFFKYGNFLLQNFVTLVSWLGFDYQPAAPDIILPVGISFYTFQTLSYTLDMYRRRSRPETSLLDFSLFVTFFPQLVAGPIVRPTELLPQFKTPRQANAAQFTKGLLLLSLGLFMKVVLADALLSGAADTVFNAQQSVAMIDAWLGVLAFSGQIFFDFAGYSTCAIGVAACLGFHLPENFRYPYAASGFSDFWRRWHITLSSWLKDYLYIALGGNRKTEGRTYINLMITMLLGGLWHGASWTFVVWGALHGSFLVLERIIRKMQRQPAITKEMNAGEAVVARASLLPAFVYGKRFRLVFSMLLTFFLVNITWVFFRAADFATAGRMLASMFGITENGIAVLPTIDMIKVAVVTVLLVATHWAMRNSSVSEVVAKARWWKVGIGWALMLILIVLSQKSSDSFIYFQF
ncbi:MAG TPA: MBOAT family O-acyltransferase [Flavisolibacter sp.]|jgi:alginate O-acetyltransferase complex protein AlgI|nr:MBOAT family O-acyltransferase [Flavisolibacter sp.]